MTPRQLAVALKPFGVRPGTHRVEGGRVTGYLAADFADAFDRYLSPLPGGSNRRHADNVDADTTFSESQSPTSEPCRRSENPEKPQSPAGCQTVGDWNPPVGGEEDMEGDPRPFEEVL
jgi:hypothetical protein